MDKELFEFTKAKVDEMLASTAASQATRTAALAWKDVVAKGVDLESATNTLLDAVSARQTTIDDAIAFARSDKAKRLFGEDGAAKMLDHQLKRKAAGARFCDCAACKPCHELLTKFGRETPDVYL